MKNYLYICQYCGKEFKPNRRDKQKYCSSSCRVGAFKKRKNSGLAQPENITNKKEGKAIDKMSFAGVGNAAAGTLAVNALTNIFTKEENKPATKRDLKDMVDTLKRRYQPIINLANRPDGSKPFYDNSTKEIVYLNNTF